MNLITILREKLPKLRRVELAKGTVLEFVKGRSYIIIFDKSFMSPEECQVLSKILVRKGIKNVTCVLGYGNPEENIKIVENGIT